MKVSFLIMNQMPMPTVFSTTTGCVEIACDMTFDESNGSQVEQVDHNILGNEKNPSETIKKMAIDEIKPQEPQELQMANNDQVHPSSSIQVEPSI